MGSSEFDPAARERAWWNAGRKVGASERSNPVRSGRSAFFSTVTGGPGTVPSLTLPLIASCADVIWSRSGSAISSAIGKFGLGPQLYSKRPGGRSSLS